jgi:hypothetical protein
MYVMRTPVLGQPDIAIGNTMFHLLVSYQGWPENAGEIPTGRIYFKQSDPMFREFRDENGVLNIDAIRRLPALLMTEIGGFGPSAVKVAQITSIYQGPRDTALQYTTDSNLRSISNSDFETLSRQYGLCRYALNHTHWEIVDFDLYRLLLLCPQRKQLSPTVFSFEEAGDRQDNLVSVMMPFSADFNPVYTALQSAVQSVEMEAMRADDLWKHQFIIQDIVSLITRARVVICDCSGRNPNVFYEVGIAHSLGKDVILIVQNEADIPFDLRHIRYLRYLNNREGLNTLGRQIAQRIQTILHGS